MRGHATFSRWRSRCPRTAREVTSAVCGHRLRGRRCERAKVPGHEQGSRSGPGRSSAALGAGAHGILGRDGGSRVSSEPVSTTVLHLGGVERALLETEDRRGTFASEGFLDLALADLRWERADLDVGVLSLDVFDTVLLRDDTSEIRRFWEIAKAQAGEDLPHRDPLDLLTSRLTATRAAYRTSLAVDGYREGELHDIYRTALRLLGDPDELADSLVARELEYEAAHLTLNPAVEPLVQALEVDAVVAVSNMYLRGADIAQLLVHAGAGWLSSVYSSTEQKVSKNDGRLFARVQSELGRPPRAFLHIGDSRLSDFVPAVRVGWLAQLWPVPRANRQARQDDAVRCIEQLERSGLYLGSLGNHFVEQP
jgi:FMN phosphatase YigB (HAD superfamily)